jgi:hypothetical protein
LDRIGEEHGETIEWDDGERRGDRLQPHEGTEDL